ncbi:MAG: aromatic aminobenezylarsenical efflux permease ArsG family transporter [Opitutales bacterium]|jgi:threonine/homoserine/homoserine lactone efflux protein
MSDLFLLCVSALWLGVLTSISPCPLATNVAAVGVLSRRLDSRGRALAGVFAYTVGRALAYVILALLIVAGLASMPSLSSFLRNDIVPFVGPVLLLAGIAVMGWIALPFDFHAGGPVLARRLLGLGLIGEFLLGVLFALSFCPVSAALFFGSLMPLALPSAAPGLVVLIYGVGTALPVGIIAVLLVLSAGTAAMVMGRLQSARMCMTRVTGLLILVVGAYLTLRNTMMLF